MKLANCMVALGGDMGNTVLKYGTTAAEIAVLRAIHGDDAVFDVEPTAADALNEDGRPRTNRQELARLKLVYARDPNGQPARIIAGMFPGAAARVHEGFDELELPEEFFKASGRVQTKADDAGAEPAPKAKKAKGKAVAPEPPPAPADDEDDIDDMPDADAGIFK
jgi:hypothetical protein